MNIRDMKLMAKESLKGRWSKILPIILVVYLVQVMLMILCDNLITLTGNKIGSIINLVFTLLISILYYSIIGYSIKFIRNKDISMSSFFHSIIPDFTRALKTNVMYIAYALKDCLIPLILFAGFIVVQAISMPVGGLVNDDGIPVNSPNMIYIISTFVVLIMYIAFFIKFMIALFDYVLVYYLANDYKDKTLKELLNKSKELMRGNKAKLLVLSFSFIGWMVLAFIPVFIFVVAVPVIYNTLGIVLVQLILLLLILLFVPVTTYMLIAISYFYEKFKPQKVFEDGYEKPETDSKKYILITLIIFAVLTILSFI